VIERGGRALDAFVRGGGHDELVAAANCLPLGEALCRTRTDDPFLTMEVLYQLS
jgi:hypothetical protein